MAATASAMKRALAWSSLSRLGISSSAIRPAAASTPACRMPPPSRLRYRRPSVDGFGRARQHRAYRRAQTFRQAEHHAVDIFAAISADRLAESAGGVEHTRAIHVNLDPGRVRFVADLLRSPPTGYTTPPAILWVFSISIKPVGERCGLAVLHRLLRSRSSAECHPPASHGRARQPENQAIIASSQSRICARDSQITSWPCSVCILMAMVLPIVPVGTNSAASLPVISAARRFQPVDGGVFAVNVVAHFGFGHGSPHGRRRPGHGIASQIDHLRQTPQILRSKRSCLGR